MTNMKKAQMYAVEDIVACKRVRGKFFYSIRWSGYTAADDTWEGRECFTAESLSYFRPRMKFLERRWALADAEKRETAVKLESSSSKRQKRRKMNTADRGNGSAPNKAQKTKNLSQGNTTKVKRRVFERRISEVVVTKGGKDAKHQGQEQEFVGS